MSRPLYPLNEFERIILIEDVDPGTAATIPVVSGTTTGFLANSDDPTAIGVDVTLSVSGTHVGVSVPDATHPYPLGSWLLKIGGNALTVTLLDHYFTSSTPYFIVTYSNICRVTEKLTYKRSRKAVTA